MNTEMPAMANATMIRCQSWKICFQNIYMNDNIQSILLVIYHFVWCGIMKNLVNPPHFC